MRHSCLGRYAGDYVVHAKLGHGSITASACDQESLAAVVPSEDAHDLGGEVAGDLMWDIEGEVGARTKEKTPNPRL